MSYTYTSKLGLAKAVPGSGQAHETTVVNADQDKIDANIGAFVCTSTTRPSSPFETQKIYETNTGLIWIYLGGAWRCTTEGKPVLWEGTGPSTPIPSGATYGMGTLTQNYSVGGQTFTPTLDNLQVPFAGIWMISALINWNVPVSSRSFLTIRTSDAVHNSTHNYYRLNHSGAGEDNLGGSAELRILNPATSKIRTDVFQDSGGDKVYAVRLRATYRGPIW